MAQLPRPARSSRPGSPSSGQRRVVRWRGVGSAAAVVVLGTALVLGGTSVAGADPKPGSKGVVGPTIPKASSSASSATKPVVKSAAKSSTASKSSSASKSSRPSGLSIGSRGDQVAALQTRLQELHYDITDTNGQFGDQTYHAVMAFQKTNGLSRSGIAGAQTIATLASATDPEPMIADGGPNRIEVDLTRQILMLYRDGALKTILSISSGSGKDFCVQDPDTGKSACDKAITPGGSFRVRSRWIGWRESKLGLLYNPLYFNGGIAIHGAPSVPGYPASHGCVRIPMVSAEWFPTEVVNGTAVYVFGAEKAPVPLGAKAPTDTQAPSSGTTVPGAAPVASTTSSTVPTTTLFRLLAPTSTAAAVPAPVVATVATAPPTVAPVEVTSTTVPAATSTIKP